MGKIRVKYTDSSRKDVILIQDADSGNIEIYSLENDFPEHSYKTEETDSRFTLEFSIAGGKKVKRYNEEEFIEWSENEYKGFRKNLLEKLSRFDDLI